MSLDVSGPPPPTWTERAIADLADLGLAIVLVLLMPVGLMVLGLPLVLLGWVLRILFL